VIRGSWNPLVAWGSCLLVGSLASVAEAHSLAAAGGGALASGFAHPFSGLDHVLAMLAIGLWASQLPGRTRFAPPAFFVVGAALALSLGSVALPEALATTLLAASVLALGLAVARVGRARVALASALALAFGMLHGHAHLSDVAACAAPGDFMLGFLFATALLHAVGMNLGSWAQTPARVVFTRAAGGAIATTGAVLLVVSLR
jgi:urease accessory protein